MKSRLPTLTGILIGLALIAAGLVLILPPIPQPQGYHDFADKRPLFGLPNFWDVISNLPFLFVGGWGIGYLTSARSTGTVSDSSSRWMYLVFFAAVALTGVGSAWYHLKPSNESLVWDRLPIAITFMALFGIMITEYVSRRVGALLFLPLLFLGAASVAYWQLTESWGRGDLRPYLLTQFYPAVAIPFVLWLSPATYTRSETLYGAIAWYAAAKLYELLDKDIYSLGHIVSGHTLKHIGAAVSCSMILSWVRQRRSITKPPAEAAAPVVGWPDSSGHGRC